MSQETRESSIVYEDPIDIPLEEEDDDEEDEEDEQIGHSEDEEDGGGDDDDDDDDEDDEDDDDDGDNQGSEILRSSTATPISRPNTVSETGDTDGNDGDMEDGKRSPSSSQDRVNKFAKLDPTKAPPGKKVPLHLLEKRRLGRIKAAEEFARKLKQIGIEKIEANTLPPTGLFQPVLLINQKNYSSDYLKKDEQVFALRERKTIRNNAQVSTVNNTPDVTDLKNSQTEANDIINNPDEDVDLSDANTTIVIHPGSKFLKIGFAKDETPTVIPCCTAIPKSELADKEKSPKAPKISKEQSEKFENEKLEIQQSFRDRMRYYKRKMQPNSREQVLSYNKASKPQIIDSKGDPQRINWILDGDKRYYGDEAIKCSLEKFVIRYPFHNGGSFNISSPYYASLQDLLSDVIKLLEHAFSMEKFNLTPSQFSQYKVVLVIPDLFEKSHVELFIRTLLTEMQFQAVAIIQESLATCYGAGLSSSTCIVNIGATQTSIACIDEGTVLENSLVNLNYGGDDITKLFAIFLMQSAFPYKDWDITSPHGWLLAEQLKKDFVTFQDANVTVQLYNFNNRVPKAPLEKYELKVFDEVMLAPLAIFYPEIISTLHSTTKMNEQKNKILQAQLPISKDIFTECVNDWRSYSQNDCLNGTLYCGNNNDVDVITKILDLPTKIEEFQNEAPMNPDMRKNYTPLEKAIVQSITNASIPLDIAKMSTFYSNILVVGGGSNIPALDFILTDRINIWRPRLLSLTTFPNFYKKVLKQAKDMRATVKSGKAEEEEEEMKLKVDSMIKEELQKYWDSIEAQNGNEHLLPVNVLPPPRDMDPSMLIWKGASVLAQIKLVEELYLTSTDWDIHGSRILQYKCLFTY